MKKATKKQVLNLSVEQQAKYCDLVWYARSRPENIEIKGVREAKRRIEKAHPTEISNLMNEELGDWAHGFNSGCLSAFRFIITAMTENVEGAKDLFPELDS